MSASRSSEGILMVLVLLFAIATSAATHQPTTSDELRTVLGLVSDGDVIDLREGTFSGNYAVSNSITLRGNGAVLDGRGSGTVLTLAAGSSVVENLTVRSSGSDLSGPDCGIYLAPEASGSQLTSNVVEDCAFGIWLHECSNVVVEANRVLGRNTGHPSNRGNGIQLFDSQNLVISGNYIRDGRDGIYVSATEDSLIENNTAEYTRYGVHYMYSYRNHVRGNVCRKNNNGFALMESKHLLVEENHSIDNKGQGLQFRDAQFCVIRNNVLEGNVEGMFFYSSTNNEITGNKVIRNKIGAKIWAGSLRNDVFDNQFMGNDQQVFYVGTTEIEWGKDGRGNLWSDYLGWDTDGDGIGDRPYRVNSFSSRLMYRFPAAALLMTSPSLETLSLLEQRLPSLRTPTITDRYPLTDNSR